MSTFYLKFTNLTACIRVRRKEIKQRGTCTARYRKSVCSINDWKREILVSGNEADSALSRKAQVFPTAVDLFFRQSWFLFLPCRLISSPFSLTRSLPPWKWTFLARHIELSIKNNTIEIKLLETGIVNKFLILIARFAFQLLSFNYSSAFNLQYRSPVIPTVFLLAAKFISMGLIFLFICCQYKYLSKQNWITNVYLLLHVLHKTFMIKWREYAWSVVRILHLKQLFQKLFNENIFINF